MLLYWIWFAELKGLTLLQKHRLLELVGDPETLYHMAESGLDRTEIPENTRQALLQRDLQPAETILRSCRQKGIGILPIVDRAYPARLRNTPDAPVVLYYKGILPDWDKAPFIGIVGTRKASAYGLQVARRMGNQIAACGGFVVSGGASGADAAAMQGSLDAGVPVVGVLGCGVDVVYPRSNRRLFEATVDNGCLISEYPPGGEPLAWHFPARNRIISGISSGVLVVEAPLKSGSLITARFALEQGRDVFVVPGNIDNPACEGSNLLLQEGATPVLSGWDVISSYEFLYPGKLKKQLAPTNKPSVEPETTADKTETARKNPIDNGPISTYSVLENTQPALSQEEQAVYKLLTNQPQEPAELIAKLSLPAGKVLSVLTMLTVKGVVRKHPGGRVSLK